MRLGWMAACLLAAGASLVGCGQESDTSKPLWSAQATSKTLSARKGNQLKQLDGGMQVISTVSSKAASTGTTAGVFFTIDTATEAAVAGRAVSVEVEISADNPVPDQRLAVAYSTNRVGNSGWRIMPLRQGRAIYQFTYNVKDDENKGTGGQDFIGILSDASGGGAQVVVHSATIKFAP